MSHAKHWLYFDAVKLSHKISSEKIENMHPLVKELQPVKMFKTLHACAKDSTQVEQIRTGVQRLACELWGQESERDSSYLNPDLAWGC